MYPHNIDVSGQVDFAFKVLFGLSVLIMVGITIAMVWFVLHYSRKKHPIPSDKADNLWLETIWTVIPTLIVILLFYYGWASFKALRDAPEDAMVVSVEGFSFGWEFTYENGKKSRELTVPVGKAVKVNITSRDVLHSFFVPAFRAKMDAVPGQTTYIWFLPEEIGDFDIFCTEYCGVGHSAMMSKLHVVSEDDYAAFVTDVPAASMAALPEMEVLENYGCTGCHSLDGTDGTGPTLMGLYGAERAVDVDGTKKTVVADDEYLKRAILEPEVEVVDGYENMMPPYAGEMPDEDVLKAVEAIKLLAQGAPQSSGKAIAEEEGCIGCHTTDGSVVVAPSFKGIAGRSVTVIVDGKEQTITSDDAYILRAIVAPEADMVKGFDNIMPAFDHLSEQQQQDLLEYLKGL